MLDCVWDCESTEIAKRTLLKRWLQIGLQELPGPCRATIRRLAHHRPANQNTTSPIFEVFGELHPEKIVLPSTTLNYLEVLPMAHTLVRELTTGDVFALDRSKGEIHIVEKEHVAAWKKAGADLDAAKKLVQSGQAHTYSNAQIQRLQAAMTHIQVLI